jgi:hypothetical protein
MRLENVAFAEAQVSGHDYLKQKLYQAVLALVSDGEIQKRLTSAAVYIVLLPDRTVPEEIREEFQAIKTELLSIQLSSTEDYFPGAVPTEKAAELAKDIVQLYHDVMDGL